MADRWEAPPNPVSYPVVLCPTVARSHEPGGFYGAREDLVEGRLNESIAIADRKDPRLGDRIRRFLTKAEVPEAALPYWENQFWDDLPGLIETAIVITKYGVVDRVDPLESPSHVYATHWDKYTQIQGAGSGALSPRASDNTLLLFLFRAKRALDAGDLDDLTVAWWHDPLHRLLEPCREECQCGEERLLRVLEKIVTKPGRAAFLAGTHPLKRETQAVADGEWFDPIEHAEFTTALPAGWNVQHEFEFLVVGPNDGGRYRFRTERSTHDDDNDLWRQACESNSIERKVGIRPLKERTPA